MNFDSLVSMFLCIKTINNLLFFPSCSTVRGRIDQVNQVLELDKESVCGARYSALDKWTNQLSSLHQAVVNKMA